MATDQIWQLAKYVLRPWCRSPWAVLLSGEGSTQSALSRRRSRLPSDRGRGPNVHGARAARRLS
eukprot:5701052-Prymnesium_polylepis.2